MVRHERQLGGLEGNEEGHNGQQDLSEWSEDDPA